MQAWEQEAHEERGLGAGVLIALLLSLAVHGVFVIWARGFEVPGMSRDYYDAIVPRTFRIERAEIDPLLLEPEPANDTARAMSPQPVELPGERPELSRPSGAGQSEPAAPESALPQLGDKPGIAADFMPVVDAPVGGAPLNPSELAAVESLVFPEPGVEAPGEPLTGTVVAGAPPVSPGAGSSGEQPGFSNLDDLLARTGPLSPETAPILLPTDLLFDYDSDALRPEAEESLRKLATIILRNPQSRFLIEGHTDAFGSEEYNLDLSARRARNVRDWLETRMGIPGERLGARGLGESRLIAPASGTVEEQQINRRVEIIVLAGGDE